MSYQDQSRWQQPSPRQGYPIPAGAPPAQPPRQTRSIAPFVVIPIVGLLLLPSGYLFAIPFLPLLGLVLLVGGIIALIIRAATGSGAKTQPAQPLAYTADGRPIYPVVGYTPDGTAITADRAIGYQPMNPRTNSLAIAALVMGFVFPLLAIPFGHVARSQIRRTGEQGGGMALAGLILGYLNLVILIVVMLVILKANS